MFDEAEYLRAEELRLYSGDVIYENDDYNKGGFITVSVRTMVRI